MIRLLLDTHAIIWWLIGDPRLSRRATDAIRQADSDVYVSAATAWEIATKVRLGRMREMEAAIGSFIDDVASEGFVHLDVEARHGLAGGSLHAAHKDPFDRLIAAQALLEGLTLVTCDREMASFGCKVLW